MDAVSASGGMREQSDDASRTVPFIFPSDIFSEILSARNDLGSLGLLDTLGSERQTFRPTTRSSPSRLSKIFLRLPLTLDVSDFSLELTWKGQQQPRRALSGGPGLQVVAHHGGF